MPAVSASDLSHDALLRMFERDRIADLDHLRDELGTTSRTTVFRRLSALGYLTSYSHAGRFYTLRRVPAFDDAGLWQQQGVCFSRHGTLKETVVHLIEEAEAGRFHRDLREQLHVRVHNTLLDLVRHQQIGRELFADEYLYVSGDGDRAAAQVVHRREHAGRAVQTETGRTRQAATPSVVIAVLLEVIHGVEVTLDAPAIAVRLRDRGIMVGVEEVEGIFAANGLQKKTARSRSRRSRR